MANVTSNINRTASASYAIAVTPSDSVDLPEISRGLYIGAAGNIAVIMAQGGNTVVIPVTAGGPHPLCVSRVLATNTTATGIVSIW